MSEDDLVLEVGLFVITVINYRHISSTLNFLNDSGALVSLSQSSHKDPDFFTRFFFPDSFNILLHVGFTCHKDESKLARQFRKLIKPVIPIKGVSVDNHKGAALKVVDFEHLDCINPICSTFLIPLNAFH